MRVLSIAALYLIALAPPAFSFNTKQHLEESGLATGSLGSTYPDILRFRNTIVTWSAGANTGIPVVDTPTPAEQLAHALDQTLSICSIGWNGGDFAEINRRIRARYKANNFTSTAVKGEGAYVFIGSALHLIEDQASLPHGANIHHGSCPSISTPTWITDNFENPATKVNASLTANPLANSTVDGAYFDSLHVSRGIVDAYGPPGGGRYWFKNEELTWDTTFSPLKSATPYDGEPGPLSEALFGAYGGPHYDDIYSDSEQPGLYLQQGKQATDFAYFYLRNISESLPPLASNVAIGGAGGGAPPIINNQSGTPISFVVAENRTDFVDIDIWVQGTGQRIVSDGMTRSLIGARNASGATQTSSLTGPITWLAQPVQMFATKVLDETGQVFNALPYETEITLNWKGMVASGAALADGDHTLCFAIKDRDGNGGTCDTSIRFSGFCV